jgi:hypothetical protein
MSKLAASAILALTFGLFPLQGLTTVARFDAYANCGCLGIIYACACGVTGRPCGCP